MMKRIDCPCCSDKSFKKCCGRFLSGEQQAKTPEQLMRSRYSAYALGGYGNYLLATWFPATALGLDEAVLSEKTVDWQKLEVLNKAQQGDNGTVEFKATFLPAQSQDSSASGEETMHEISTFKRNGGKWFYVGGEVS